MKRIKTTLLLLVIGFAGFAQLPMNKLTLDEVLTLAKEQSPNAILAKHRFRASYWQYRSFKAELLPSLSLSGSLPSFTKTLKKYELADGTYKYIGENTNSTSLGLSLSQNIALTGGKISIGSNLERTDLLDSSYHSYLGVPVSIQLTQPLFGINTLKWSKKIEPLKYEEAKRGYIQSLEEISIDACRLFFNMAMAQQDVITAKLNYSNTDTLYKIAQGRYNIGTIAENELLQMELSFLNAGTNLNEAEINLIMNKAKLKSFLGLNDQYDLELILPSEFPRFEIHYDQVLQLSKQNNPQIIQYERQVIEANRDVAQARSERGFSANLYASYGLTQTANEVANVYKDPQNMQRVQVGFQIPILDWGLGKGKVKMAQSNLEVVKTTVSQALVDFEQDIFLKVMQFNLQDDQVLLAQKADTISQNRYEVTKQRFLIGKIDVLDLNVAQTERDAAKTKYINAISSYWQFYYQMRKLTLQNLEKNTPIEADFEMVLK